MEGLKTQNKDHDETERHDALGFRDRDRGRQKERRLPPQMTMAGTITSGIERRRWGQGREYRNGLMRPEITHSLLKITAELAEILGIPIDDIK